MPTVPANTVFLWNTILANNSQLARNGTVSEDHNLYFGNGTDGTPAGNPKFVSDSPNVLTGTWTSVAAFTASALTGRGTTVLTASGAPFVPRTLAGRLLNPKTSQKRQAYILDNTASTITVVGDMAGSYSVVAGDGFKLIDYQLSQGSAAIDAANPLTSTPQGINGVTRGTAPDAGACEFGLGGDMTPPTATLNTSNVTALAWIHSFTVSYADNFAVDVTSLSSSDIRITGTNGFNQLAVLASVDAPSNGTPRTASYQVSGPSGAWNSAANGIYTVSVEPNRVRDTSANLMPSGPLGTFSVAVSLPSGNFFQAFDFSRLTGDRDSSLGTHQPSGRFDDYADPTSFQVSSSLFLTASTTNAAWAVMDDEQPDVVNASRPTDGSGLRAVTNFIVRTRIENFTSGLTGEGVGAGILFGLDGAGATANGYLARVERVPGGTNRLYLDAFTNGRRGGNLATTLTNFSYASSTTPYFLELSVAPTNAGGNWRLSLIADPEIPGTGRDPARLGSGSFATAARTAFLSGVLTNLLPGFVGLHFEDNTLGASPNTTIGNVRFSNFYISSTNSSPVPLPPLFTGIRAVNSLVEIDFSAAPGDPPASFALERSSSGSGPYLDLIPAPAIAQVSPGAFRVVVTANGSAGFYRVRRLQ